MAKSYLELQKQIEVLTAQAEKARQSEVAGVVARIREAIATYGITLADLNLDALPTAKRAIKTAKPASQKKKAPTGSATSQYQDGNGNTWGGRGPRPRWLREAIEAGATLESFAAGA